MEKRYKYYPGCQMFPDGVSSHCQILGGYSHRKIEGYSRVTSPEDGFFRDGCNEIIKGGDVVFIYTSRKVGSVDSKSQLVRVVVRSWVDVPSLLEKLEEASKKPPVEVSDEL